MLSCKAYSVGNIIFFFLIGPILGKEMVFLMVEDNCHQWDVQSNSKLCLGLKFIEISIGVQVHVTFVQLGQSPSSREKFQMSTKVAFNTTTTHPLPAQTFEDILGKLEA